MAMVSMSDASAAPLDGSAGGSPDRTGGISLACGTLVAATSGSSTAWPLRKCVNSAAPMRTIASAPVNAKVLDALGPKGYVCNIARGSVIDEPVLLRYLQQGKIAGAGLDVFVDEPKIPPEFFKLYEQADIPMPDRYAESERPRHPYLEHMRKVRPYDAGFTGPEMVKRALAAYFGSVSFVDHNVGQVLHALEEAGLSGNTRVIYGSDHGENLGTRGLWAKSTLFEESAGIPLILSGPDVPSGKTVARPVSLVDVFPTVLECAGVAPSPEDKTLPGKSLLSAAHGRLPDGIAFSEYHAVGSPSGSYMIRRGRFKYIHYCGYAPMLYDLEADPHQFVNLWDDPARRALRDDLVADLYDSLPREINRRPVEAVA